MTATPPHDGLGPADIKRLGYGFCHAKLLLTATELGLFADLDQHGPATAAQVADRLALSGRGLTDFLNALAAMGLLARTGGSFALTPAARVHLVPTSAGFLGGFLSRSNRVLYPAWGRLADALRTGEPQVSSARDGAFERMLADPDQRRHYLDMMDSVNGPLASLLADAYDWSTARDLVDVGGARGNLAANLVRARPHLSATVFDLPVNADSHAEHMAVVCPPNVVSFVGGDFFVDALPEGDVLILGHVLHNWSSGERALLVKKAFDAVRPGGALLVYDAMLDDEAADLDRLVVSLNMLLVTKGGSEYPASECQRWMAGAGFVDVTSAPLGSNDTLVVGRKA